MNTTTLVIPKIQKIALLILMLGQFSCNSTQDEGQVLAVANDPDVATWTKLSTNSPRMHSECAMAYDTLNKKIIIYGGRTGFPDFDNVNETWGFDYISSTWTNLHPTNSPPWRSSHSMVYDALRHKVLLFGGNDFIKAYNDLWEYDYSQNTWTKRSTTAPPEARQMHGMVYIPGRDAVIIFGGRRSDGGASFADTWEFNCKTSTWKKLNPTTTPPVTDHVNMAYDKSEKKVILFTEGETWALDFETNNWEKLKIDNQPNSDHSNFVYSDGLEKSILFGNIKGSDTMITWAFNYSENSWTNITPDNFPKVIFYEHEIIEHDALVYLPQPDVIIQYGGCCSDQTLELSFGK